MRPESCKLTTLSPFLVESSWNVSHLPIRHFIWACLQWNAPLMWDRFITYLLSGFAQLFVGPTSDHFQCLTPDHKWWRHVNTAKTSWNPGLCVCVYKLMFVWLWESGRQSVYLHTRLSVYFCMWCVCVFCFNLLLCKSVFSWNLVLLDCVL